MFLPSLPAIVPKHCSTAPPVPLIYSPSQAGSNLHALTNAAAKTTGLPTPNLSALDGEVIACVSNTIAQHITKARFGISSVTAAMAALKGWLTEGSMKLLFKLFVVAMCCCCHLMYFRLSWMSKVWKMHCWFWCCEEFPPIKVNLISSAWHRHTGLSLIMLQSLGLSYGHQF